MEYEQFLKTCVKHSEERFQSYKDILEIYFKEKWDLLWYKDLLRELKNNEEIYLKKTREELTYYRQGLNSPSFYPY